jgi:hypothetical protein
MLVAFGDSPGAEASAWHQGHVSLCQAAGFGGAFWAGSLGDGALVEPLALAVGVKEIP